MCTPNLGPWVQNCAVGKGMHDARKMESTSHFGYSYFVYLAYVPFVKRFTPNMDVYGEEQIKYSDLITGKYFNVMEASPSFIGKVRADLGKWLKSLVLHRKCQCQKLQSLAPKY